MPDRGSVMQALKDSLRNQHCGFIEGVGNVYAVSEETINDTLKLLKEQEELLRKLQKDKDKLCLEVSEWKHKFYDAPPKFVPQGIVDQIVFERDAALSQLEQLGKGLGSTFLMRELSDNR